MESYNISNVKKFKIVNKSGKKRHFQFSVIIELYSYGRSKKTPISSLINSV